MHVTQVQRVLKILVIEGSLQQEHVALLWDLTEKVNAAMPSQHKLRLRYVCSAGLMYCSWFVNPEDLVYIYPTTLQFSLLVVAP